MKGEAMRRNLILSTDSYKLTHHRMYMPETAQVYSYMEARLGAEYEETTFFGLQAILKRHFMSPVTMEDVEEADQFCDDHFGMDLFNRPMWEYIVKHHEGRLPLRIKAVPEGMRVPNSNVLMTVENTDTNCASLTNHAETLLLQTWYPSTIATVGDDLWRFFKYAYAQTGAEGSPEYLLHDFGFRGGSSAESAGIGGMAHLVHFRGTDTIEGVRYAQEYYPGAGMPGNSVPASEHSVMTSLGEGNDIYVAKTIIAQYPHGILSIVSDSYDIMRAVRYYCTELADAILARTGKFVVRPDSPRHARDTAAAQVVTIAELLARYFGFSVNEKGYKTLHPKVGIIYGDGLSPEEIKGVVNALALAGFDASTCVFGMGGGRLQRVNRDTQRFSLKCSAQVVNGEEIAICKDSRGKASKPGKLKLIRTDAGKLITVRTSQGFKEPDLLETVYENGRLVREHSWDDVVQRAQA